MSNCIIRNRNRGSQGEPSTLLERINKFYSNLKRPDGSNPIYDELQTERFLARWGGDYSYKEPGETGYEEFQKVEKLYENSKFLYEDGEPKFFPGDNINPYVLNYKGEKIFLNETIVREQDRLDIANAIFMTMLDENQSHIYDDLDAKDRSYKKIVNRFFDNRIEDLKSDLQYYESELDNPEASEEELEVILDLQSEAATRLNTLETIRNTRSVYASINASLKQTLSTVNYKYSTEDNIENQDEDADVVLSFDDIANHTKESNEIRDTENIDSEILILFSSIIDFNIDKFGNISNKFNQLMGDRFVLGMSPNRVKNRVFETVSNIIEIEADIDGNFVSSYDAIMTKLNQRVSETNDELLRRFLDKVDSYTSNLSKQDLFSFQVKFFKAASKAQQNFILTEINDSENDSIKITYIDPSNIQNKEYTIGKDLFLSSVENFRESKSKNENYLSKDDLDNRKKYIESIKNALNSAKSLQTYFEFRGVKLNLKSAEFLILNKDNLGRALNLTAPNYTLKHLLEDFSSEKENAGVKYNYIDKNNNEVDKYTSYYSAIETYNSLERNEQEALIKALLNNRLNSAFHILGKVESIFKTEVGDSSFNIAGKSRWRYSLMGGINKEILRWKSGDISRLEALSHRNIPYVDYLLANRESDRIIYRNYANDNNIADLDEARRMVSKQRIENVQPVIFAQLRKGEDVSEFKSVGEGDLHLDHMFKIMNFNDEIYDFYKENYQGANSDMINNFIEKTGKMVSPFTNNADRGSALGIKGLTDPTDRFNSEVSGLVEEDGNLVLDNNAKKTFKNLLFGEIISALKHQTFIQEYYRLLEENPNQNLNYLMSNLIPEVHYTSNYTVELLNNNNEKVKNKKGKNKTKTYKFKPDLGNQVIYKKDNDGNIIVETGILYTGFVNRGTWNKLGVFNSVLENNKEVINSKLFTNSKPEFPEPEVITTESFNDNIDNADINAERSVDKLNSDKVIYDSNENESDNLVLFFERFENLFTEQEVKNKINLNTILYKPIEEKLQYNYEYLSNLPGNNITNLVTNISNSNTERSIKQYTLLSLINEISLMNMFNGELMFFKQGKNSQVLSLEDFLKRGPAPSTDGLQMNIISKDTNLYIKNKKFNSASEARKDNYLDYNGNQVSVDRNSQMVFAVINNLDISVSKYADQISDGLGYKIKYGHEIADAGAYITLGFYKRTMLQTQGWSEHDEKMFTELSKPNTKITQEHYDWLKQSGKSLQPVKLVGYDFMKKYSDPTGTNLINSIDVPVFLKFAPAILTPSMVNGTDVQNLLEKMENDGVDLIVSKSGSKVANQALTTIHTLDDKGNYNGLLNSNEMKLNPSTFNLSNLKWQVELPSHYFDEGNIGTQHMKNLLANLNLESTDKIYPYKDTWITAQEVLDIYQDSVINILKLQFKRFKSELGIDILDGNNLNYKSDKLREFLIRELDPAEDFHIISLLRNTNNPIETIPGIAQRMFPVLAGYIKKKVGKVNTNMGSVIQVANIGYDRLRLGGSKSDILFLGNDTELTPPKPVTVLDVNRADINNIEGLKEKEISDLNEFRNLINIKNPTQANLNRINELKDNYKSKYIYYEEIEGQVKASVIKNDNNKMKINEAKILLPFADIQKALGISWEDFKQLIDDDRRQNWENGHNGKSFDKRILENIISYRIPNQSISSNDKVKVVGILPPNSGDQAIVYHEITAKAGSDFDVDKLYLMLPTYKVYSDTQRVVYSEQGLGGYQNQLIEAMGAILQSPATFDDLISPLDSDIIKDSIYNTRFDYFKKNNPDSGLETLDDYKKSLIVDPLTMLTPAYKVKSRVDMTNAKQLVASMANHMTHVPFSQIQKIVLEKSLGFGNTNLHNIYVDGFDGDNQMKITKIVSYFMNAAVDAAKDNYIIEGNFNSYTANAAMVLVRSGVHPEEVFKLLLHPDILEISQIKQAETELITDIKLNQHGLNREQEDNAITDYLNFINNNPIETNKFEDFLKHINNESNLLKGYWLTLVETGKQLADDISVSKPEAKGAGKNIYEHIGIFNKINQVSKSNIGRVINGEFRTLNHLYKDGIVKDRNENFKPEFIDPTNPENDALLNDYTMFGMIMNNSLLLTNLIAKNMFIEASDNYVNMINKISEISGNVFDTSENNIKDISKMLYPIVVSNAQHELYDMSYNEQVNLVKLVNDRLKAFKAIGALKDNMFLDLLQYNERTNLVEFPSYKTFDARDKNQIRYDFSRLYNAPYLNGYKNILLGKDADKNLKKIESFAKYLIAYSYIASGFKRTRNSFEEFLPAVYFGESNHGLAIDNLLNVLNNNSQNAEEFNNMIDSALSMLAYTNPKNYKFVKDFKNRPPAIAVNKPITDTILKDRLINKRSGKFYPFITYISGDKRILMKLVSIESSNGIDNPVYEFMQVGKSIIDSSDHTFLYTSLFKYKGSTQTRPLYLLNQNNEHSYYNLSTLLLNPKETIYESRLDGLVEDFFNISDSDTELDVMEVNEVVDNQDSVIVSNTNTSESFTILKNRTMEDISILNNPELNEELNKITTFTALNEFIKKYCN